MAKTYPTAAKTPRSVREPVNGYAGGGVKRGYVHGASDKNAAFPDRDGVRPDDLAATMFQLLGIDPQTEVRDSAGRPLVIASGNPISEIVA
jgi:hypothetical protein